MTDPVARKDVRMSKNCVKDGASCRGCGLSNYEGLCPVCRGDEAETRHDNLPYPFDEPSWGDDDPYGQDEPQGPWR